MTGVDVGLAHERIPPLVAGLVGCGGSVAVALLSADVAPAAAVGDVAELLHVDVQHCPGVVVLVAAHWLPGGAIDVRQPVQVRVDQDPVDRGRCDPQPAGELDWAFAQSEAELDAALRGGVVGLVR